MSGLKNVLGNVYGDPEDRPQKANLDDVKESMDALTDRADAGEAASDGQVSDASIAESDTDKAISDVGEMLDDSQEESPWAMLDELPDLTEDPEPVDEPSAAEAELEEVASEEPTTDAAWLSEVKKDGNSEDWLNDYDDTGWTGSKQDETQAPDVDSSIDIDELANFDFAAIEESTDEASVEDLVHNPVGESNSRTAESFTELPTPDDPSEASATDDLDPGQEAWLDDLFSLDEELEGAAAATAKIGTETEEPVSQAPIGLDAVAAVYSASDLKSSPDSDTTASPTIEPPAGGFYGGWARIDDDILPQKKSGGRRGRKQANVAIAPDSQQMAQAHSRAIANDVQSATANTAHTHFDPPHLVEANFESALLDGFTDEASFAGESGETATQLAEPAPDTPEVPSFDQPLLQSDEELEPTDAVHLFAHDEALEEAATAGGRRKARKEAAKQAKADKAAQAKANKDAARLTKADASDAKKAAKNLKGRRRKNKDDNTDDALRAQVDAALAAQVATNADSTGDDFWTDNAAVPAAEITPSAPAGMADPLDTELVSPPPAPDKGFDPGPVLD